MAHFVVTTKNVSLQNAGLDYYTFVGTAQAVARYLAEHDTEVLIASLPIGEDSLRILLASGYEEKP